METNHTPGTKYPVGTRYSNSVIYDEATDEVAFGFQVFRQCLEDGTPTGRKSFVDNSGILCSIEIAEQKRHEAIRAAAPDLLEALRRVMDLDCPLTGNPSHETLVEFWEYEKTQGRGEADDRLFALYAIARATGTASCPHQPCPARRTLRPAPAGRAPRTDPDTERRRPRPLLLRRPAGRLQARDRTRPVLLRQAGVSLQPLPGPARGVPAPRLQGESQMAERAAAGGPLPQLRADHFSLGRQPRKDCRTYAGESEVHKCLTAYSTTPHHDRPPPR